jgi:hypothetical protein
MNMKSFLSVIKLVVIPLSSIIGMLYAFDVYVIERANTVVEPTKVKVELIHEDIAEIKARTKNIESILMERR